jgi:hypothetical protein
VLPPRSWPDDLLADLDGLLAGVAGSQGRLHVPLPAGRRPTDWERVTAGLAGASWATADMTYRRAALVRVGGFDERFPRAYREDADLALRLMEAGFRLARGSRTVDHPVLPAVGLRSDPGRERDDALPGGRRAPGPARPRSLLRHIAATAAGLGVLAALAGRHRRAAALGGVVWAAGTAELAWARIAPLPRTSREIATMVTTSVAIPR